MKAFNALQVFNPGVTIATSGTSASASVPPDGATLPRFVRIAATAAAYVRLGKTTATAAAGDMLVQPGDSVVVALNGCDVIAALQVAAAGVVQVSPVSNSGM